MVNFNMTNEIYPENDLSNSQPNNLPKIHIPVILITLICFLLISVSVFAFCLYNQNLKLQKAILPSQTENTNSLISLPTSIPSQILTIAPTSSTRFGNIVWFSEPRKMKFPPIFRDNGKEVFSINEENGTEFYQVASFSDGSRLIDGRIRFEGPGDFTLVRFIESKDQYFLVTNNLDNYSKENILKEILLSVQSTDINLPGLESPETVASGNITLSKLYETPNFLNSIENARKIFDSPFGPVYESIVPIADISGVFAKKFFLKLNDGILTQYQLSSQPSKDNNFVSNIIWSDGTKNKTDFNQNLVATCSLGGVGVPFVDKNSNLISNRQEIGKSFNNQSLYQITDSNNLLVKELYRIFKTGRDYPSAPPIISLIEFAQKKNHFLWQDIQGDWQIFSNSEFSSLAECGKPVIYLYPEKETVVNVQVGAKISKSEPFYPPKGWTVLAKPNGELIYQGKTYPNLFWEGLGLGEYPNYKKQGIYVDQKNLIPVLKSQLKRLGLNEKESKDFMDFWQPKLPQSPYVRLTWLNTDDMDKLAPLAVYPKPDTRIRVFLEFEGLEKQPKKLIPQKLPIGIRKGFTLIEWGGLLIK